jgi:Carboxypeptidase regulatory-like domain
LEKNEMDATLKSVCLRAVGLLLLSTSSSCVSTFNGPAPAADLRPPAVVQGHLIDDTSGKAIADAIVEWSVGGRKSETSSDSNGAFSFSVPPGATREVVLSTTANLYRSEQRRVEIRPEETTRVRIGLRPRPQEEIGAVRGTLKDADTGRGIPDAVVSIRGAGGRLSTTTGPDGSFNVERVGFNSTLKIHVTTPDPPCISPIEHPLAVHRSIVEINLSVATRKEPVVHCSG